MDKDVSINVSILLGGQVIDLRIPKQVKKRQLKQVMTEALKMMRISIPGEFELQHNGKMLEIGDTSPLEAYGVGDGEQIEIVLGRTN